MSEIVNAMGKVKNHMSTEFSVAILFPLKSEYFTCLIGDVNKFQRINYITDLESCISIYSSLPYYKKLQLEIFSVNSYCLFWLGNINNLSNIIYFQLLLSVGLHFLNILYFFLSLSYKIIKA